MSAEKSTFGVTKDGKEIELYKLKSGKAEAEIITYGAIIRSLKVPHKNGDLVDVVLGCDKMSDYETNPGYLGCMVGRVANRIKQGKFVLNGQTYHLAVNNGPNHLHGGLQGFNSKIWDVINCNTDQVKMHYKSVDGEEGYPGTVDTEVIYRMIESNGVVHFTIETKANSTKATPVVITNHSYFNLAGENEENIFDHEINVTSDNYLPTDNDNLVTGQIASVTDTPYDLRKNVNVGERIQQLLQLNKPAFDAYYCLSDSNSNGTNKVVTFYSPKTSIRMQASTDEPGFQFYTAHYLNQVGKNGRQYGKYNGACFEFQGYPDAVNNKQFPNVILSPGEIYHHSTTFSFDVI